jgi:hypothetical protein
MQITKHIVAACALLAASAAMADVQYEQGQAFIGYTGKSVPPAVRAQAIQAAEFKAIQTYYAKAGGSESANFESIKDKVASNLDQYVLDETIIEEQDRKDVHEYTVSLRAKLNVSALDNAIKSASGHAAGVPLAAKSRMTFLVVARQASTQTDFDARTYQRTDVNSRANGATSVSERTTEGESVSKSQVSTNGSRTVAGTAEANTSVAVERGGSTMRKASETSWRIFPSANMDQVLTGAFHQAGFRVTEASDVEPYSGGKLHVVVVQEDYKSGMDLKSQTLQDVEAGLRNAKIPYLTLGTLDIGFANPDPATGLLRVPVTVNAKVLDLSDMIPDTVATVGPVQYAGLGPTEAEAQTNALRLAAQNAAKELISQLNNAGVR